MADELIKEDDLLKSIQDLAPKVKEPETQKTETVVTAVLEKSAADVIAEKGTEALKKSLDVSETLREVTTLLGAHVDTSLAALQKSVSDGAQRDLAFVKVISALAKSVTDLSAKVESFGNGVAAPVTKVEPSELQVLEKSTKVEVKPELKSEQLRKSVSFGLEKLVKSAQPGSPEIGRYLQAAVQFEATGVISDQMLAEAKSAMTPAK